MKKTLIFCAATAAAATVALCSIATPVADARTDGFYTYAGAQPLSAIAPGTVLKTRIRSLHVPGLATKVKVVQLVYRTTGARQQPTAGVTSVLIPPGAKPGQAIAYQSFYDSLNPEHGPSRTITGTNPSSVGNFEFSIVAPFLAQQRTVIMADDEGPDADFLTGTVYGPITLDSVRAATRSPVTGLDRRTRIGLFGYSGGAMATAWTVALAPSYAPDVNRQFIGAAMGGVPVRLSSMLRYIDGSAMWAMVTPLAVIGVARAYGIDLKPYLNPYGAGIVAKLRSSILTDVMGQYSGLTWAQMAKPRYRNLGSTGPLAAAIRKVNLGIAPTPTTPLFVGQGNNGLLEGTPGNKPGIGSGDGVIATGDIRGLLRQYCRSGNRRISYQEDGALSHGTNAQVWMVPAIGWLDSRFAGAPAGGNCSSIAPGNPLK